MAVWVRLVSLRGLTELIGVLQWHRRSWDIIMMSRLLHVGHCADRATQTHMILHHQCWGKLLLKVMHYNIALLSKKVTNYVT